MATKPKAIIATCQKWLIFVKKPFGSNIAYFKAEFSEVIEFIKKGITIRGVKGRVGKLVGYFGKDIGPNE